MKYLLLPLFPIFAGCDAFNAALADPGVQRQIITAVETVTPAATTGDWTNTEVAGTSAVGALLVATVSKWLHGRMKNSEPGRIIG